MRKLLWGRSFIRSSKRLLRKHPELASALEDTLQLLVNEPFHPALETHKLKGKLSGSWACSMGYDLRIVFDLVPGDRRGEKNILLMDIGSHDEVC
ncbi:MAG: type II toxin-antitoxin system mRNA interferase toxin, RelE/StbE family [bacterium]